MRNTLLFSGLLACSALTGCVTPLPQSKNFDASTGKVEDREVIVSVAQSEVNVQVDPSNAAAYTGGGLLGALIATGINQYHASSAEDTVKPVRAALVDYDFDKNALESFRAALSKVDWMSVKKTAFTKEQTNENYAKAIDASPADQVVYNAVDYAFSYDFTTLKVNLFTSVYSKASAVGKTANDRFSLKNAIYYHRFSYETTLPAPAKDKDGNAKLWADNHAALTRKALDTGLAQLSQQLVGDLQLNRVASAAQTLNVSNR